jgi:hypothetical protein
MDIIETQIENWHLKCIPEDGGRISVLQFAGQDLLTPGPLYFRTPLKDHGEFETRPVYGYDDCFPTVDLCRYPGQEKNGRDHGELCWQKWQVKAEDNSLNCRVDCHNPRAIFNRTLVFDRNILKWKFSVINLSNSGFAFLHVMHALMPLMNLQGFELPGYQNIMDEITCRNLDLRHPRKLTRFLMEMNPGKFRMLLVKNPEQGLIKLEFKDGTTLLIDYPVDLFPTLGIWWNNQGYPDEDGLRRMEFAFEPIPGSSSSLEQSFKEGRYLFAEPGIPLKWEINWTLNKITM